MSSRSSGVTNVVVRRSLISSVMRLSFLRSNAKSSRLPASGFARSRTKMSTLSRASSALFSSSSKNTSSPPINFLSENIAPLRTRASRDADLSEM